jgi:hypothetical protein
MSIPRRGLSQGPLHNMCTEGSHERCGLVSAAQDLMGWQMTNPNEGCALDDNKAEASPA